MLIFSKIKERYAAVTLCGHIFDFDTRAFVRLSPYTTALPKSSCEIKKDSPVKKGIKKQYATKK